MKRILTIALPVLVSIAAGMGVASARQVDLDTWIDTQLVPYARRELSGHPRFRNQVLQLVVLRDETPQSDGSELEFDIRDRLRNALNAVPGVRILWSPGQSGIGATVTAAYPDCASMQPDYLVGVQLNELRRGSVSVTVRALDLADRSWVQGFGQTWEGNLSSAQHRQYRTRAVDADFRGARNAPWHTSELDLMAAHLARSVGCKLLRQPGSEYVLTNSTNRGESPAKLIELVGHNLAGNAYLQFADDDIAANAVIAGKAHRIDDDLYQYWITVTPLDPASGLASLGANAYVRIEDPRQVAALIPEESYELPPGSEPFLDRLSIVMLPERSSCAWNGNGVRTTSPRYGFSTPDDLTCYALQVRSDEDAVVFFLNHQLNNGLVRLAGSSCSFRTDGRIARQDDILRFPLPVDAVQSGNWTRTNHWSLAPREDAYFAIGSKNSRAARALSAHIAMLPKKCSASMRAGLEGPALRAWLDELQQILSHWGPAIDWRGIRIKEIY